MLDWLAWRIPGLAEVFARFGWFGYVKHAETFDGVCDDGETDQLTDQQRQALLDTFDGLDA